jgi:hypothetical protein
MNRSTLCAGLLIALSVPGYATDVIVDAAGAPGTYPTLDLAMQAAVPGDRILVQPGTYPAFDWSKSVRILGLGAQPSDVKIARVDFQPKYPAQSYDMLLSNVSLESSDPIDAIKFTGNELPPGVLVLDGVEIHGAVYLGTGPQGMYVLLNNCSVQPEPGQGFLSTAVYLGGTGNYSTYFAEIVDSRIQGHAATAQFAAGHALRLSAGVRLRISGSTLTGGSSVEAGQLQQHGADAIRTGFVAGAAQVELDGGSVIVGGSSATGNGGAGVALNGNLVLADATVLGGTGMTPGAAFSMTTPQTQGYSLRLTTAPSQANAAAPTMLHGGSPVALHTQPIGLPAGIAFATMFDQPGAYFSPLLSTQFTVIGGNDFAFTLPVDPSLHSTGLYLLAQGYYLNVETMGVLFTNSRALRGDL